MYLIKNIFNVNTVNLIYLSDIEQRMHQRLIQYKVHEKIRTIIQT